jgi:hypothetical protein
MPLRIVATSEPTTHYIVTKLRKKIEPSKKNTKKRDLVAGRLGCKKRANPQD